MSLLVKRLNSPDAGEFQRLRLEGLRHQEREFRFTPEDQARLGRADVEACLAQNFVAGAFGDGELVGIAGLSCVAGEKVGHKALLWGMYLRASVRGFGAADALMAALMDHARTSAESVTLTVVSGNPPAIRLYERWGVWMYGVEPAAVKLAGGSYLDETLMIRRFARRPPTRARPEHD